MNPLISHIYSFTASDFPYQFLRLFNSFDKFAVNRPTLIHKPIDYQIKSKH